MVKVAAFRLHCRVEEKGVTVVLNDEVMIVDHEREWVADDEAGPDGEVTEARSPLGLNPLG